MSYSTCNICGQNMKEFKNCNIFSIDSEGKIIDCSQAMLGLIGYSRQQAEKSSVFNFIHKNDVPLFKQAMQEFALSPETDAALDIRFICSDKTEIYTTVNMISAFGDNNQVNILAICLDISKQKLAEAEIDNQNAIINMLYETSLSIINRLDVNDLLTAILKRAAKLVGTSHGYIYHYHPETDTMEMEIGIGAYKDSRVVNLKTDKGGIGGKVWRTGQLVVVEDYSVWSENLPDLPFYPRAVVGIPLKSEDKVISIITLVSLEEGRVFCQAEVEKLMQFGQLASIALNNAILFTELKQEIADRKKAEEALYESTQQLMAIMDSATDFMYVKDDHSVFRAVNPAMYNRLNLGREAILGKSFRDLFNEVTYQHTRELDQRVLKGETVAEELILDIDDAKFVFDKLETPLRGKDGKIIGISGIMRDITERKKNERDMLEAKEILARSEKFASLGVMAGGISHEINQPLNSIKVNATGLLYRYKKGMPISLIEVMDEISEISAQVDRIDNIVKHMRAIIRDEKDTNLEPCNLNQIVEHAMELLNSQIRVHGIRLNINLDGNLRLILATETGLEEVLINIVMNAIQALEEVKDREKEINIISRVADDVILEICDNGPGISDEIKARVFDPFFSTKKTHHNMGLGLSITQSIVNLYQGSIYIQTDGQQETCFVLRFPIYK